MCNPRRIRVTATRNIAESWQQEIRRQVHRSGQAIGEARIREPLGATLGTPTLAALATVLARTPGWERSGEAFQHPLDGGYIRYDPVARELEIVAIATATVEASGEETTTVSGTLETRVEAEGEGIYYSDGWRGLTAVTAQIAAEANAEAALDAAEEHELAEARREADERLGRDVERAAASRAETGLEEATAARVTQLRQQAAAALTAVGIEGRNLFHRALGMAYRDAILAYARSRGGEGIRCTEQDGTVDIEFTLDIQ